MPRVNRDLQRRLAARRERERRRPAERRYNFAPSPGQSEVVDDEVVDTEALDADSEVAAVPTDFAPRSTTVIAATRGGARPSARPFSAYGDEYAYVYKDLRRVAAVIGGLLLALLVLYFVLPLLVH